MSRHSSRGLERPQPAFNPGRRLTTRRGPQEAVREAAAWVVERTLTSLAPVDSFLSAMLVLFDDRDQALLRELVFGTLRWLRRIDSVLAAASSRRIEQIEPVLLAPLRVGAYQLLYLDRVPSHAAVNEAVEHARSVAHRGAASFVNGVLRRIARSPRLDQWPVEAVGQIERLAIEWSHPELLVRRWLERFGTDKAVELMRANNQPKPLQILSFRSRGGRALLAERLIDQGLDVDPCLFSPLGLTVRRGNAFEAASFQAGEFYVQDEISQLASLIPLPRPGEKILDVAAAPGGKSFAIHAWEPSVRQVSADVALDRLAKMRQNQKRLGLGAPMVVADAGMPPWSESSGFSRVVVDLPCTGTGTLRRNPEIKWRLSEREIVRLSGQALRLLRSSARHVAPGGLLIAITCSLEAEENEELVGRFLASGEPFQLSALEGRVPREAEQFILGRGFWRVATNGDHDGFSVHVLHRKLVNR